MADFVPPSGKYGEVDEVEVPVHASFKQVTNRVFIMRAPKSDSDARKQRDFLQEKYPNRHKIVNCVSQFDCLDESFITSKYFEKIEEYKGPSVTMRHLMHFAHTSEMYLSQNLDAVIVLTSDYLHYDQVR